MRFSSAISTAPDVRDACQEASRRAAAELGDVPADLAVVFASAQLEGVERVPGLVHGEVGPRHLVGCTGGGIIGGGQEVESALAVSVTLASLPGVDLHSVHLEEDDLPDEDAPPSNWVKCMGSPVAETRGFVVLPEPFTFAADRLLVGLDFAYPDAPKIGGMASGHHQPGGNTLFHGDETESSGAVVLGIAGDIAVESRVAQGCKPFGAVGTITKAKGHDLFEIDSKPALEFLQKQLSELHVTGDEPPQGAPLFLGIAMDPFSAAAPTAGEFLIRQVIGYDPGSGTLRIGEILSVGRAIQFHLRDRESSADDLRAVLGHGSTGAETPAPRGALLFSCLGRGQHLYGEEGHDSGVFADIVGSVPLGGFFCNGEIGPVQGTTHLHGYTSSFAFFGERPA